jgi:MoaA/NifB/PqqE/SkfB family radical SAM enzyme
MERLPEKGLFQLQLEGGEPTIHPEFWDFVRIAREHPRCTHLVVCTNGVVLPRRREKLLAWLTALGAPLTIKISVNHHLIERDPGHVELVTVLRDLMQELGGERLLVVNVRLRRGTDNDDQWVREAVERAGLQPHSNVFFLQRYGFAADELGWDPPSPVWSNFTLVNPDGKLYGPDLVRRSEGMRVLK